ncbi:hypothetical protein FRB95_000567 [Tulasnella sp. JGI-2019a]|nr:hypothetical protein FRB95_000567 [Tulasnella sp. JGI-2019a]
MPKFILPPSSQSYGSTRYGDDDGTSPFRTGRQTSFGASASSPRSTANLTGEREKRELFFVIAMELDVPLSGIPPNSPYMFILPLPRCLNNSIRLRMPTDSNLEENTEPTLETMTIPQVQAQPLKSDSYSQHSESPLKSTLQPLKRSSTQSQSSKKQPPRPHSHRRDSRASVEGYPADDELDGNSSEDTGVDEGDPVIEGTFLSADHLTVRWALRPTHAPLTPGVSLQGRSRSNSVRSNGRTSGVSSRARVAVDHVESSAKYTIFPMREIVRRPEDGRDTTIRTERLLPVALEYTARCVGFSHPGVATGVALEVALDEGSEGLGVDWDDVPAMDSSLGHSSDWTFSSSPGIIDWDWAPSNRSLDTRPSSYGSRQSDLSDREASYGYRSGLVREDTLLSEGSSMPSGSRRPLSRQFEPNGDSVTLEHNLAVNTSLMRAPLPNPALLDDTFNDERPASGYQPLSRESTGPSAMSVSQWSLASSRHSRTTASAASDSVGDLNGGPVSRTQTEIEYYPSSSSIPTMSLPDLEPTPPSNPILLDIDLHALLTSQKVPNPSMAQANFTFKGRILISLPESVEGGDISAALPMFRLSMARSHECKIYILPSPIISNRELSRPFGVRFEGGKKEVIDPVVQGEAVYTVKVASSLAKEGVVPITLVYPLPPAKGKVTSSSAINKGLQHSTVQAVFPSDSTSMMSLNKCDPPPESRSSGQRGPADELWMPSPFASTLTSPVPHVKQEPDQQQPNGVPLSHLPPHSPEDLAIAWSHTGSQFVSTSNVWAPQRITQHTQHIISGLHGLHINLQTLFIGISASS